MLSGHESNKDQEQGKTGATHLQKSVSRQWTNLGIRRDEWDHQSQTSNTNYCCQDSYLIALEKMDCQLPVFYRPITKNNTLPLKYYTLQSNILTFWLQFNNDNNLI